MQRTRIEIPFRGDNCESRPMTPTIEPPVFVTNDDRRARRLRRGAFVATALSCLWLVGLGVGMFGFGGMPGVSFLNRGDDEKKRSKAPPAQQAGGKELARQSRLAGRRGLLVTRAPSGVARAKASQGAARVGRRFTPVPPPAAPPPGATPSPQQPVNPAQRTRGWARKGHPAPPGQVRKTQPPPPGSRGQRRGRQTTTATTTPLPPGQAKKTPPPPPPG